MLGLYADISLFFMCEQLRVDFFTFKVVSPKFMQETYPKFGKTSGNCHPSVYQGKPLYQADRHFSSHFSKPRSKGMSKKQKGCIVRFIHIQPQTVQTYTCRSRRNISYYFGIEDKHNYSKYSSLLPLCSAF